MQKISIHNEEKVKELLENKWKLYQKMLENY